jgi:hypothetical protein
MYESQERRLLETYKTGYPACSQICHTMKSNIFSNLCPSLMLLAINTIFFHLLLPSVPNLDHPPDPSEAAPIFSILPSNDFRAS